jgi:AcrR family transcriptional regulator
MKPRKAAGKTRRNFSTQIRKEQIAQAALDVVAEQGVSGLSAASVARRVGLVPSALYRHFKRKDQILDAVLELIDQRLMENVDTVQQETSDPVEQLHHLLTRHVAMIRQNQVILRIVFSEAIYGHHQAWRTKIQAILNHYLQAIASTVRAGQRTGHLRRAADPDVIAVLFLGLVQPAAILWHISNGKFDLDRQVMNAWKIFHRGIVTDGTKSLIL